MQLSKREWLVLAAILGGILAWSLRGADDDDRGASDLAFRTPRIGADVMRLGAAGDTIGCASEATFKKVVELQVQRDEAAIERLLAGALATRSCRHVTSDERFNVTDASPLSERFKLRIRGTTEEMWLFRVRIQRAE